MDGTTRIQRRTRRERYVELAALAVGMLLVSWTDGPLRTVGVVLGLVAAVAFLWSTFRDPRIGPLQPATSPRWPLALAVVYAVIGALQQGSSQWLFLGLAAAFAVLAVQAAVPARQVRKVLDVVAVAVVVATLAVVAALLP